MLFFFKTVGYIEISHVLCTREATISKDSIQKLQMLTLYHHNHTRNEEFL